MLSSRQGRNCTNKYDQYRVMSKASTKGNTCNAHLLRSKTGNSNTNIC